MISEKYLDAILSLPDMYDIQPLISPDGTWVAWTWFQVGPAADVFAAPTDGSMAPVRMTETPEHTILVSWTPDSRSLIVEQDKDGNERVQLFRVDLDVPQTMVPLTEPDPNYYIRGGQLHPTRPWLVYGANLDVSTREEIEPTWVYRHNLETGERRPLAKPIKGCYTTPLLNLQGSHILYSRSDLHPAGRQVWLVDIEGQEDREILNFGPDVKTFARWLPDGQRALVMVETATHRRLGIWELAGPEIRWLLDDPARDIEEAFVPYGSNQVVVVQNWQGKTRCALLDLESSSEIFLPEIPGNLIPLAPFRSSLTTSPTPAGNGDNDWVGFYYSSQQPTNIVRFSLMDLRLGGFISLAKVWERTKLKSTDFTPAEDFCWTSVDGIEVHGWLYRPKGTPHGSVAYIHGGPTWHSQEWINPQIQFLVSQGFNVLDINYRGSTGYGLPFRKAILEDGWGGREQEDIRTGIEALIEAGIAQKGKVGITGTSYGGYSSWWAITHFPLDTVAASVPICGMTDLVVDYETTRPDLRPYSAEMMGGSPSQVPDRFYERSPIHFIHNIRGKLLIVQGAQDPNVTPKNVEDVVVALNAANISHEVLTFEDEGHGISKTANKRVLYLRLAEFLREAFR
jgi:dipeptidyl aminopeptidase/acylaminoacyl peptidase